MSDYPREQNPPAAAESFAAAKARFLLLLKVTAVISVVLTAITVWLLYLTGSEMSLALVGSVAIGTIGTLMMAAALVGLVFLSHSSGTDADVDS